MPREEFDKMLLSLALSEKIALLLCSVMESDTNALATAVAVHKLNMRLSEHLGTESRARFVAQARADLDNLEGSTRPVNDEQRIVH
jgi:hypothetical protein